MSGIGDRFQQETKYYPDRMPARGPVADTKPKLYKVYDDKPKIELPAFVRKDSIGEPSKPMNLDQTLRRRKSIRDFQDRSISLGQLSYLLWASTGIQRVEHGYEFRTAPSAGALYPIETYIVANDVSKLDPGLYHYAIRTHQLEQLSLGDLRRQIAAAALRQGMCASAAAAFVWSAMFDRCKIKYGQRAYRYVYLDAGHIAENLALAAVSLNLGTCEIGALYDDQVNAILGVDGVQESVVCMVVVGVPA